MSDKAAARARFEGVFDQIADELIAYVKGEGMPVEAIQWYKDVSCRERGGGLGSAVGSG